MLPDVSSLIAKIGRWFGAIYEPTTSLLSSAMSVASCVRLLLAFLSDLALFDQRESAESAWTFCLTPSSRDNFLSGENRLQRELRK